MGRGVAWENGQAPTLHCFVEVHWCVLTLARLQSEAELQQGLGDSQPSERRPLQLNLPASQA